MTAGTDPTTATGTTAAPAPATTTAEAGSGASGSATGSPMVPNWPPRLAYDDRGASWSLRRWLVVVGVITLCFALAAGAVGSLALARLSQARSVVIDEIQPALLATQHLSSAVIDQENGVRGYSLSGREDFLTPYHEGVRHQQQSVDELRRLSAGGHVGDLADELDTVLQRIELWRNEFAAPTVAGVRAAGGPAVPVDPERGKAQFDAVRVALTQMQTTLGGELDTATEQLRAAANFVLAVFLAIALALVAVVVAFGVWLRRSVIKPMSRLATEVRLVVSGDAHREVRARGPSEIEELAADVDAMRRHILAELDALEIVHQRLDEQARDLERSNRDLEQFAYVASHDLQEPLRKVSSFCQLLQRRYGGQLDERADSYIAFAVDGARRMQQLINDLLAFSRVGRISSGMVSVNLNAVVDAAVGQVSTVVEETGARIHVAQLPTVCGEAPLLTQLLANLVGNSLKFRRPDLPPEVSIDAQPHEDGWEICVRDNGIGVEPEYAEKVFVIFQRLHSREDYPGTGIGLAMAKKIVEYHGGRIWFDPDRTDGATVRFTLPADPAASDLEESTP